MKKIAISFSFLLFSAAAVTAADDPIAVRQALMQANAASAGAASAMLKGEMDYNPVVAKAAIATFHSTAEAMGDFFPEGSNVGETRAAPAIWENPDAFRETLAKFRTDAAAAVEASGRDGPADLEAFRLAVMPVFSNCSACHENFRLEDD